MALHTCLRKGDVEGKCWSWIRSAFMAFLNQSLVWPLFPVQHSHSRGEYENWLGSSAGEPGVWWIIPNRGRCLNTADTVPDYFEVTDTPVGRGVPWEEGARSDISTQAFTFRSSCGWREDTCECARARANVRMQSVSYPTLFFALCVHTQIVFFGPDSLTLVYDQAVCSPPPPHFIYNRGRRPFNPATHRLHPQFFIQACLFACCKWICSLVQTDANTIYCTVSVLVSLYRKCNIWDIL